MGQLVSLTKAVRMLGIDRHDIQRLIHDGKLAAPDGMVDMARLRECFPGLALQDDPVLERVQLIKTTAFSRRVRSTVAPDHDALEVQIRKRNAELSLERAQAKKYRELLEALTKRLAEMQLRGDAAEQKVCAELNRWLLGHLD